MAWGADTNDRSVTLADSLPLLVMHAGSLGIFFVGVSPAALLAALVTYLVVALLTLGEGWHNNHHCYAVCARQGFAWWKVDFSYCVLRLRSLLRLVWDVRAPTQGLLHADT